MAVTLQDQVVKLIPSKALQSAIEKDCFHCSDSTLLSIIFDYAPDFYSRIEYMKQALKSFTGEIKNYTERLIDIQYQMRDAFFQKTPGTVYELHIKKTPDAYDETYLCESFESAMEMIPLFFQEYECKECAETRYEIVKRHIFSGGGEKFSEDDLGEAVFLPGGILHSVSMYMYEYRAEDCGEDHDCLHCNRPCVLCNQPLFPCFVSDREVVEYLEYGGEKSYGIVLLENNAQTSDYYIIPLDSERIRYHDFENTFYSHTHVASPLVEKSSPDKLPVKMRDDYFAYLEYLNSHNETST